VPRTPKKTSYVIVTHLFQGLIWNSWSHRRLGKKFKYEKIKKLIFRLLDFFLASSNLIGLFYEQRSRFF